MAGWALSAAGLLAAVALRDPRWPLQWLNFLSSRAGHIGSELSLVGAALHLPIGRAPAMGAAIAMLMVVVAGAVLLARTRRDAPNEALAVVIGASLLAAPHALESDLVLGAAALALAGGFGWLEWAVLSAAALVVAVTHDSPWSTFVGIALIGGLTLRIGLTHRPPALAAPVEA